MKVKVKFVESRGEDNKENTDSNHSNVKNQQASVVNLKGQAKQVYWQNENLTANDIYATNLFIKVLHFTDSKYPLS